MDFCHSGMSQARAMDESNAQSNHGCDVWCRRSVAGDVGDAKSRAILDAEAGIRVAIPIDSRTQTNVEAVPCYQSLFYRMGFEVTFDG
jgi:hypothetical protein